MKAASEKSSKNAAKSEQAQGRSATVQPSREAAAPAAPGAARPGPGLDRRSLQRLQGVAGNGAVSRLVAQRYAPPVKKPPSSAPGFRKVTSDVEAKKRKIAEHPPAAGESKSAQDAAKAPSDDKEAQGKVANSEKMDKAKPGEFDKQGFIDAVNKAIADQAPKNLDEAEKFSESGKAENVKEQVDGKVSDGKKTSAKDIETTTKADPDTSAAKEKEVKPMSPDKPPANPGAPDAEGAVPDKQPPEVTDFSDGPKANDKAMADADVTEEQLKKGNEPEFDQALGEKKKAEADSAKAPDKARAAEKEQLAEAKQTAAAEGSKAMAAMTAKRGEAGKQVDGGKSETKSKDEQKREQVTAKLQKVFDATKKDVEKILDGLDKKVDDQFTKGEKAARKAFEADQSRRMKEYKDKRYSGLTGKARWVKDKFAGLPDEANQLYQHSRKLYVNKMQGVVSSIADTIGTELGKAKARIKKGRSQLKAEVDKLPQDLQKYGQEAAKDFAGKFDDLESEVNDKSKQLVTDLATKYTQALNKVDERIKELQEANKGLIDKAKDAIAGAIKTIMELKDLLMGILAKAAGAIAKIIKDPIGFLKNLVKGVGAGLELFIGNIADHLKKGLVAWLLGTAVKVGIELPAKFDLKGIIQLIASTLGLTWETIRARVTRKGVPDKAMDAVESQVPVAKALAKEGPSGAADEITGQVGDLKSSILEDLKSYLIPTVIIAGITWIVSLLNPASAFIRAVKAIIDIVSFVVNQGAQIVEFVNAVLDAVVEIANGGAAGVPKMVEAALAASIPLLIGLLASLLGIGGLANKVKQVIQKASRPVKRAIDKIVDKIAKAGKKLWRKLKGGRRNTDAASVRSAARRAVQKAWKAARAASESQVISGRDLQAVIDRNQGARRGVGIKLHLVENGDKWGVRAVARKGSRRATAEDGSGWVAKDGSGSSRYVAEDLSAFNRSLIDEAFTELKRDTGKGVQEDLRTAYKHKTANKNRLEQSQQDRLNGKVKGLRFAIKMEPFTQVEKDKQIHTTMNVSPNESEKKDDVPVVGEADPFPYEVVEAEAPIDIEPLGSDDALEDIDQPMKGAERRTGFVVNLAATASEAEQKKDMAVRYADKAWEGASEDNSAMTRVAVVAGINTFKSVDPKKDDEGARGVQQALAKIEKRDGLRTAVFGFQWTPSWKRKGGGRAPLNEVRKAFLKLSAAEKESAQAQHESRWRDDRKLPYGIFREEVLGSGYTRKAVDILSKVNSQVHIVSQDADGDVMARDGRGVLAVYDEILKGMEQHPLLTIGGYTFEGFDWAEAKTKNLDRTKQLTELNNELDRAIRVAISEIYTDMLYPTEPNMLIKAHDDELVDGIFQNQRLRQILDSGKQGKLYGVGATEGRTFRNRLKKVYGKNFSVAYTPEAATTTSPLPDDRARGLTVYEDNVPRVVRGDVNFIDGENPHTRHPMYAALVQSQAYTSAQTLSREFARVHPELQIANAKESLNDATFVAVEEIAKLLADNPELTRDSEEVRECLAEREADIMELLGREDVAGKGKVEERIKLAHEVTKNVVTAMTGEELKGTWRQLHDLLKKIMDDAKSSGSAHEGKGS